MRRGRTTPAPTAVARAAIHAEAGNALQGVGSKRDDVESRTRARQGRNLDSTAVLPVPIHEHRPSPQIAMKPSSHLLRLEAAPTQRDSETVRIVTRRDPARHAPLFRAPVFPTPHQFSSELPFTVNFPPRFRPQS